MGTPSQSVARYDTFERCCLSCWQLTRLSRFRDGLCPYQCAYCERLPNHLAGLRHIWQFQGYLAHCQA